jgi:YVTN family beta-propeller protein
MIPMPLPFRPANLELRYSRIFNSLRNAGKLAAACAVLALTVYGAWNVAAAQTAQFIDGMSATITVGNYPDAVAVNPAGTYAYVANGGDNTVSVIATATNTVVALINVGSYPDAVAVNPAGTYAYVANGGGTTVSVIDTATNTVTKTITVGIYPGAVAVNPAGTYAYVANSGGTTVSVIDTATNTVSNTMSVGLGPVAVAVNPAGTYAYVAIYDYSKVSVINTATNTVTATINVGRNPDAVAVNPAGTYAYVANNNDNTVSVIYPANNPVTAAVTATINVGSGPLAVAVNPAGSYAYVANGNDNTVSVIDTATNTVTATIPVGNTPYAVAVNPAGTYAYVANSQDNTISVIAMSGVNFGPVNVGSSSASPIPLSFAFDSAGTIGAPAVLTQGAANKDFTLASGGTCTAGAYSTGDTCMVNVTFTPAYSGERYGEAILEDSNGNTIAAAAVQGTGVGPQVAFSPGSQKTIGSGFPAPDGVAVDGSGNVYIADYGNGTVYEMLAVNGSIPASPTILTLGSGFLSPTGIAVDGSGNIYLADQFIPSGQFQVGAVQEILAVNGKIPASPTILSFTVFSGFNSPNGLAVDASGNVYVADTGNAAIYEMLAENGSIPASPAIRTLGSGFGAPNGVAVAAIGNVYVADGGNPFGGSSAAVYEMLAVNGSIPASPTILTLSSGFSFPQDVAVDASGNVYVTDSGNNALYEMLAVNGSIPASPTINTLGNGFNNPYGVAVAANRNVYVADSNNNQVVELDYADPPSLNFLIPTAVGSTSSDSPKTVTVNNVGNAPLTFTVPGTGSNPSYAAAFPENTGDTNLCASGTPLAAGSSCDVSVDFTPTEAGVNTGSVVLMDNALNVTNATQSITLSGTATQVAQNIFFGALANQVYGAPPFAVSATASSGLAVSFASTTTGVCTVAGSTVTLVAAGTCTVQATQAGNADYPAATPVSQSFTVNQAAQIITFIQPASPVTYGVSPITLSASGGASGNAVVFSVASGPGTVSGTNGSTLTITGAGTVVVAANQAGNTDYTAAAQVTQSIVVNQARQIITFTQPTSPVTYGVSPITLSATGGASGNPVIFNVVSGPGSVSDSMLTITGAGTVVIAANQAGNINYTAAPQVMQSVVVTLAPQTITFTPPPSVVLYGVSPITLSATGGASGNAVVFSILSGPGSISGSLLTITGTGTVVVAADQLGNTDYTAAQEVTQSVTVLPAVSTAPTEPVNTQSGTQTATVLFNSSFTLGSINVLTQGATGLDFKVASGGTCDVGTSYTAGQTCTVNYTFTPTAPGTRYGAITVIDNSSNLQASLYLNGTGIGPLAIFSSNTIQNALGGSFSFSFPTNVALDGSGNVFTTDYNNAAVYEILASSGYTTVNTLARGFSFSGPDGVAVDGSGNLFVTDYNTGNVYEILATGGYTTVNRLASGFTFAYTQGVAVDGSGNLFVADSGNNAVEEIPAAGGYTAVNRLASGFTFDFPSGVALDGSGNVYVADSSNNAVEEILSSGGYTAVNRLASSFSFNFPSSVALDGSGNVYVANTNNNAVEEILSSGGYTTVNTLGRGFSSPYDVAVDAKGDVYVADSNNSRVVELDYADPPSLSFASTAVGSASSDSPQTMTLDNDGNAPLVVSGLSTASANFSLSGTSTCTSSTTLATNSACNIGVTFAPTVPGSPLTDAVTITDNNLNVAGAVQTARLSGTGTQQTATVTVAPVIISYSTNPTTLSASVMYLGATAPSGAVSFMIDGGSSVTAICAGSSSPLTCTASYSTGTLSATTHTITATLVADTDFTIASGSATLMVTPIAPTITFAVPNHAYGDAAITLAATSNSGAPITYSLVSGPASVSGSTLNIAGAGTVTVQAAQIAAGNYIAGSQNASFTVAPMTLAAAIVGNPTKTYDGTTGATLTSSNYQLSPLVGSDVISVTQPSGVYASATAGPEGVTAALSAANFSAVSGQLSNYILPTVASGPGTITQAATSSIITWNTPAAITYGTPLSVAQLNASSTIAGSFSYSPAAGTVLGAATQTLTATFTPTDITDYKNGGASVMLLVNQATPTINWPTPAAITYGAALNGAQLNATASVAGTFSYSPAGGVLTAGSHLLSVTFTPTDTTDYTSATSTVTLLVNQATPTINWPTPAAITYGAALSGAQLDATASVAGTFSYSPAGGVLTAGSHLLSVTFTPTDTTDYTIATQSVTLTVNKATPFVTWATPAAIIYGTALSATQLDATANVFGAFTYSPAAGTVPAVGTDTLTVTFTPTDATDYTTATASVVVKVNPAPSFTLGASPASLTVTQGTSGKSTIAVTGLNGFDGKVTLSASGLPSGVTVTFSANPTTGTSVLTFAASNTAPTGTYNVTVTGISGSLTAITTVVLTVNGFACHIVYTIETQWPGGFEAAVTIDNTGVKAISNWTLTWTFASGQKITDIWDGTETQSGANVTVTNMSYNGSIPAGGNYTGLGFNGTWNNTTNAVPTSFAINGTTCK